MLPDVSLARTRLQRVRSMRVLAALALAFALLALSCKLGRDLIDLPPLGPSRADAGALIFSYKDKKSVACEDNKHLSCKVRGEFLEVEELDCTSTGQVCNIERGCIACT